VVYVSNKRKLGKSKYNFKRLVSFGLQGIISFSKIPLKLSVLMGLIIAIIGIIYGVTVAVAKLLNPNIAPAGWVSIMVLMLVLGGVQLIALGVIGEYISTIVDEVKDRPLYIIESWYGKPREDY
jgi:dolichol-phosphate mannosyltransferase